MLNREIASHSNFITHAVTAQKFEAVLWLNTIEMIHFEYRRFRLYELCYSRRRLILVDENRLYFFNLAFLLSTFANILNYSWQQKIIP